MTKNRLRVGQQKLDARVKMERQADVSAVKILLWLELYPNSYKTFQNVRATHPPDTQECERIWTHEWKDAFQKIKDHQLLKYFSESGPAEGQGDASKDGFGFLILQHGQPVTSGALLVVERKYSQIEKEFLAAFIGKEPNHQ